MLTKDTHRGNVQTMARPTKESILIVDASPELRTSLDVLLGAEGHPVVAAGSGSEALEHVGNSSPDIIAVASNLPDMGIGEVCRRLRSVSSAPIILLVERGQETERMVGMAVGASDYLMKPFAGSELFAKISAATSQFAGQHVVVGNPQAVGPLYIDRLAREVRFNGEELHLTKTEFDLLVHLAARPDLAFSRSLLIEQIWGEGWVGDRHIVDVHIANLRRKIDRDGVKHIKTVRGVGYRFAAADQHAAAS